MCFQAFSELQLKMVDTQQKVKMADLQIDQLIRVQKHAKLTYTEISGLPDSTRMYEGAGRMWVGGAGKGAGRDYCVDDDLSCISPISLSLRFILQSKEDINEQLIDKQKTADEKIKELEVKHAHLLVIHL